MSTPPKKKNESPSSNYREEVPKGKVPQGDKVVKQPEDTHYDKEEADFENPAKRKEESEQPVHPVKSPPSK